MLPYAATLLLLAAGFCAQDVRVQKAFANIPKITDMIPDRLMTVIFKDAIVVDLGNSVDSFTASFPPTVQTTQNFRALHTRIAVVVDSTINKLLCPGGQVLVEMRINMRGGFELSTGKTVVPWKLPDYVLGLKRLIVDLALNQSREIDVNSIAANLRRDCFFTNDFIEDNGITGIGSGNFFYTKPPLSVG